MDLGGPPNTRDFEKVDANATRLAVHEKDTRDALTVLDDATDCIRYGLMADSSGMRH